MKVFLTLSIFFICLCLQAQVNIDHESYGLSDEIEELVMPLQDNASLRQAELRSRKKGRPDCFAKSLKAYIDPHQNGTWDYTKNDMAIWRHKVISKDAKTINLGFSKFLMPQGGKLFLIGKDKNSIMGPFTPADNEDHGQLWTPVVEGDEITIEIQIPISQIPKLDILLEHVNHDFINILKSGESGSSGSCNVDVVCGAADGFPIIDTKRNIINSVGAYTLNGTEQCSGVLINNGRNDCMPYFLTANHCEVSNSNAASVVVYWNYENSVCRKPETVESGRDGDGELTQFTTGSSFISGYAPSDFTLLLLDDDVLADFSPYFAGWNVGRELPDSSVCVHHPNIEEKRISFDHDPNIISVDSNQDTFVRVESWELGTTERGSSGAPLFNSADEVIGLLNSGQATCNNNEHDDFGPMFLSWEGGGTPETRLKDWLDPDNIGMQSISGKNCTITLKLEETVVEVCGRDTDTKQIKFEVTENFEDMVNLSFNNLPRGLQAELEGETLSPGASSSFTLSNIGVLASDNYQIELIADDGTNRAISKFVLKVFSASSESVNVIQPKNGSSGELTNTFFSWTTESEVVDIELSTDDQFDIIVFGMSEVKGSSVVVKDLVPATKYYWRIRAQNICGVGDWSSTFEFTTGQVFCSDELQNNESFIIPQSRSDMISSTIEVNLNGVVRDVQITNIMGEHTWIGDLSMNLISPSGTIVNLIDFVCEDADDFSLGFSDTQGEDRLPCPITDGRLYQPNGDFSSFIGELASGAWQLQIIDIATLDGGVLNQWGLEICTEVSSEAIIYLGNDDINTCGATSVTSSVGVGLGFGGDVTLAINAPAGITAELEVETIDNGGATKVIISDLDETPNGTYQISINATDGDVSITEIIDLVVSRPLVRLDLSMPPDGQVNTAIGPELVWEQDGSEESFFVQVSTIPNFSSTLFDTILMTNKLEIEENALEELTEYFWRVAATNGCNTILSETFSFTTEEATATFELADHSFDVYPNPVTDRISISSASRISHDLVIKLYNVNGKLMHSEKMSAGAQILNINVGHFINGLYFLKLTDGSAEHTEKVVIDN